MDVEPCDVSVMLASPNRFDVFATKKALESGTTLERLTPDEVVGELRGIAWKALGNTDTSPVRSQDEAWVNEQLEDAAVAEMRAAGITVPDRPSLEPAWEAPATDANDDAYGLLPNLTGEQEGEYTGGIAGF